MAWRREGIKEEEEFMWRGKEREMRKAGIDGKYFSRKYGGRVPIMQLLPFREPNSTPPCHTQCKN